MRRLVVPLLAAGFVLMWAGSGSAEGVGDMARGSGHVTVEGEWRTFSFTAQEGPDGTDRGQLQVRGPFGPGDIVLHMVIDCLRVSGNYAVGTGTVTVNKLPEGAPFNPEGVYAIFAVQDLGEGASAPDRITTIAPAETGPGGCERESPVPDHAVEAGNIQVTDA
jgi:hypothetical protein